MNTFALQRVGKTDLEVTALGFGGATLGTPASRPSKPRRR